MATIKKKKTQKPTTVKKAKPSKKIKIPPRPKPSEQYKKALKDFDKALHEMNRGNFAEARTRFLEIIGKFPQERVLKEKVNIYVKICDRKVEPHGPRMREINDYYNVGILRMNDENYEEAVKHFEKALSFEPRSEKVLYALAAAHALKGNKEESISQLKTAIRLEPRNRVRAKMDPDFDSLRTDSEFNELIEPTEEEIS